MVLSSNWYEHHLHILVVPIHVDYEHATVNITVVGAIVTILGKDDSRQR